MLAGQRLWSVREEKGGGERFSGSRRVFRYRRRGWGGVGASGAVRRISGDPRRMKGSGTMLRGVRRHVAQRRGPGRHGGARGRVGEARRWLRPQQLQAATTVAFGRARERETEEGMRTRESAREVGGCVASRGRAIATRRQAGRQEVAGARRAHAPVFWREVGGDWRWPVGWAEPGGLGQHR